MKSAVVSLGSVSFVSICSSLPVPDPGQAGGKLTCSSPTSATAADSQGSLDLTQLLQELPELLQSRAYDNKLGLFIMLRKKTYAAGKEALMMNTCHEAEMRSWE